MERFDTVVVGAGPAGLAAAETLADADREVLVLEKNREVGPKICAGGLTLKDLEIGIPKRLWSRSFSYGYVNTPHDRTKVEFGEHAIITIDRKDLGQWMLKEAEAAGAQVWTNAKVDRIGRRHVVSGGKRIGFRQLIGADGSNSLVRQHLGLAKRRIDDTFHYLTPQRFKDLEVFFDVDHFGPWYAWIFPHKTFTSVGTGGNPFINRIADQKRFFDEWCEKRFPLRKARYEAFPINCDYHGFQFGSIFLAGDAAGFASELTGEGIFAAIVSGRDIARRIVDRNHYCKGIERVLFYKQVHERMLDILEKNRFMNKIEYEVLTFLLKIRFIDKEVMGILA
ncbi:NAD(P)/FAD-dependent oxidoreductase [Candidatus Woesearchaeota archaeon]|nr:NAD(P)/FAD-dependent oxidoreductase [Candidatus Woesearchaeota archaeon]